MKRIYILVAILFTSISLSAQELVVASYNIRNDNSGDAKRGNGWAQRCPIICDQIEWNNVDIFGCKFDVGDDCIAIKSGTIDLAKKYFGDAEIISIKDMQDKDRFTIVKINNK